MPRLGWILILVAVGALVLGLLAAALVIAAGPGSDSAEPEVTITLGDPPRRLEIPLAEDDEALMLAQRKGRVLVGIAVRPGEPLEVAAVAGEEPVRPDELSFSVDGKPVAATPCGHACSRLDVQGRPRLLVVNAPARFRFQLPPAAPPAGAALFRKVERKMASLRSHRYDEKLTSGVGTGLASTFEVQAPDRMEFRTTDGFRSIIIGKSRWDLREGRWERSAFPGLRVPTYMWEGARNARILGRSGATQILSVFDREPIPAWFRLTVDARGRVLEARMLAPSHFMEQRFSGFNAPITIRPPK